MPNYKETISIANELLSGLGEVTVRSQFGAFAIVINGFTLAQSTEQGVFVRLSESNRTLLKPSEASRYRYYKKNRAVRTGFYLYPDPIEQPDNFVKAIKLALELLTDEKPAQAISELLSAPNLTMRHVLKLNKVGVYSYDELKHVGAYEVGLRLREASIRFTVKFLYKLQGAIEQCHWSIISMDSKQQFRMFEPNQS